MSTIPKSTARQLIVLGLLTVWLGIPATASAGTYDVYSCDQNRGGATPGWNVSVDPGFTVYGQCNGAGPEGLVARSVPSGTADASAFQSGLAYFDAPAGTTIESIHAEFLLQRVGCNWGVGLRATGGDFGGRWVWGLEPQYCGANSTNWLYFDWPINDKRVVLVAICGASSCDRSSESRAAMRNVRVTINDPTAPSLTNARGDLWTAAGWLRGSQQVGFDASDGAGIRRNVVRVDDQALRAFDNPCNDTQPAPCPNQGFSTDIDTTKLSDGAHKLTLETVDSAGNPTQVTRTIQVDNTAPTAPSGVVVDGGDGWRSGNGFSISWTNPPAGDGAPIAAADYRLCRTSGADCTTGTREATDINTLTDLQVPAPGEWALTISLRDGAGNSDSAATGQVTLRFDSTAPEIVFEAPNPSDPTLVSARATDGDSGIAEGRIEIRKRGSDSWQALPSSIEGGRIVARLDDEQLSAGRYRLRAWARDTAGNERTSSDLAEGGTASVRLPIRVLTEIKAGAASRGKRRRSRAVRVPFGKRMRLGGRLTTADGNPVAASEVLVFSREQRPEAPWTAVAAVRTSPKGYFGYRAPRGVSRVIRFRFSGTATIRPSIRDVKLVVPAKSSIRARRSRLVNGEYVDLRGRVLGGAIPGEGKLVEIQVFLRGHWRTFGTTRTGQNGRWRYQYRFDGTRGTQVYRMRARLPQESAFPYAVGRSRALAIRVRGL